MKHYVMLIIYACKVCLHTVLFGLGFHSRAGLFHSVNLLHIQTVEMGYRADHMLNYRVTQRV